MESTDIDSGQYSNLLRRRRSPFVAIVLLIGVAGVFLMSSEWRTGAGSKTLNAVSGKSLTGVFGIKSGEKLGFLLLIDFDDANPTINTDSNWEGYATHDAGKKIEFEASMMGILIDGREYDYDAGQVFLIKGLEPVEIRQLDIKLSDAPYSQELDRVAALPLIDQELASMKH